MPWSNTQKQIAVRAARVAGLADEYRRLVLRQFPNSLFDEEGAPSREPSSKSAKLTNADFEGFMGVIEYHAGGQIQGGGLSYSRGYWQAKAADPLQRVRHLAARIAAALVNAGKLEGDGLASWIPRHVTGGRPAGLAELSGRELHALINGLRGFARNAGVEVDHA